MAASLDDIAELLRMQIAQRDRELAELRAMFQEAREGRLERRYRELPSQRGQENATFGTDRTLQLIASDPWRGLGMLGVAVPPLATSAANPQADPNGLDSRYLIALDAVDVAEGQRVRIRGVRQSWAMLALIGGGGEGAQQTQPYPNWFEVTDPRFRLRDGNISWHLTFLGHGQEPQSAIPFTYSFLSGGLGGGVQASDCANLAYQFAKSRALLWAPGTQFPAGNVDPISGKPDFETSVSVYVPPNKGRPWGDTLRGGFSTRYDQFTPWLTPDAWHGLDIVVDEPGVILFSASVRQCDSAKNTPPGFVFPNPYFPLGDSPAQQFVWNYKNQTKIGAVAGALVWENA